MVLEIFGTLIPAEIEDMLSRILLAFIFLIFLVLISRWQALRMGRSYIIAFTRGFIQLILVAFILEIIFDLEELVLLLIALVVMSLLAAQSSAQRFPDYPNILIIQAMSITVSSIIVMGISSTIGIIDLKGEFVIPMGGMVISNSMVISGIVLERIFSDISKQKGQIEAALSLGASVNQACKPILRDAFRAGVLPTTNRVAILGIVSIPGLMSGMIIGGMNPTLAAIYQIIIFLMILAAGMMAELIAGYYFIKQLFTKQIQLKYEYFVS
ncbi:MAG: ABC transporter permease [Candidatus Hodarchaeales archaeon]|jgi:putative ABC transport system permease protein